MLKEKMAEVKEKKKIVMVAPANNPHTIKFAHAILKLGYELKIVSWSPGSIENVEVYVHSQIQPDTKGIKKKFEHLKDYIEIRKRLQWADIVFVNFIYNWRFNEIYRGINNIVVLLWGSDISYNEAETEDQAKYKKLILSFARRVLAFSKWLASEAKQYLPDGVDADVLKVGVNTDEFFSRKRYWDPDKPVIIGYAKGLYLKYGPDILIQACDMLRNENLNFRCKIAGSGTHEILLKKMVNELNLDEIVEFTGWLPPDSIPEFMRGIDIFAMPSICRESFGVAALEAAACEVPVVASDIGGIHEVIWNNETGYLLKPDDPVELANALKSLIESPDLRSCMGRQGRDFVLANFQWERTVKQLHQIFEEILEES